MDLENYEFLDLETNEEKDLEDTLELKESLELVREQLQNTIIEEEDAFYE